MRFDEIYMYCIHMYEMKIPVNICLDIKQFSSLSDILFFYISIFHLTYSLFICGFILLSVFVMSLSTLRQHSAMKSATALAKAPVCSQSYFYLITNYSTSLSSSSMLSTTPILSAESPSISLGELRILGGFALRL